MSNGVEESRGADLRSQRTGVPSVRTSVAPLRYSTHSISEDDIAAVVKVLRSDWLTCGPVGRQFEEALAAYCGAKYAVAVNSGTAALYLAYRASGVSSDGIVTSPLTFMATVNAFLLAGGESIQFQDVDPATGNMLNWPGATAAVPVHFAGRAADMTGYGPQWYTIEDACHALGAMDFDGCSRVGSCAHSLAACFSFHPVKPICTGEGGAVTTNDQGFADEVRSLRDHGRKDGLMVSLSGNFRMADINAALGLSQLARCDEMREKRQALARRYEALLIPLEFDLKVLQRPEMAVDTSWHAWHLYPIRIKNGRRDEVMTKLRAQGIGVQKHYDPPVHLHPYYRSRLGFTPGAFPEAEAWAAETLSLPLHSKMTEADVRRVVDVLRGAL